MLAQARRSLGMLAVQISLLIATTLPLFSTGFAQNIPSGPTAVRKGDMGISGRLPGLDAMPGNLGLPVSSVGSLGGANFVWSCQPEKNQIAKLIELNRLLDEKISELGKQLGNEKLSSKKSE